MFSAAKEMTECGLIAEQRNILGWIAVEYQNVGAVTASDATCFAILVERDGVIFCCTSNCLQWGKAKVLDEHFHLAGVPMAVRRH